MEDPSCRKMEEWNSRRNQRNLGLEHITSLQETQKSTGTKQTINH